MVDYDYYLFRYQINKGAIISYEVETPSLDIAYDFVKQKHPDIGQERWEVRKILTSSDKHSDKDIETNNYKRYNAVTGKCLDNELDSNKKPGQYKPPY